MLFIGTDEGSPDTTVTPARYGPKDGMARQECNGLGRPVGVRLSAGQQQRVVVARALLNHPQLLLADEPTSDLDEQTEIEIMELFRQIHQDTGITIVMVTHASQLVSYGTRAIQMAGGKIIV